MTPGAGPAVRRGGAGGCARRRWASSAGPTGALNAGGVNATPPLPGVDAGTWHAGLAQNLTSVFYCLKYQIPAMTASAGGSIINNASIGGVRGIPGLAPYTAAKHGVVGLAHSAALEGAARG